MQPFNDENGEESSDNEYIEFKPCNASALQIAIVKELGDHASSILQQMLGKTQEEQQRILNDAKDLL